MQGSYNLEIKCIQCTDKSHVPEELRYRDRGHMYYTSKEFISFLRDVDTCVMANANDGTFRKYGSEMIDVGVKQLEATKAFQQQFKSLSTSCMIQRNADADMTSLSN